MDYLDIQFIIELVVLMPLYLYFGYSFIESIVLDKKDRSTKLSKLFGIFWDKVWFRFEN